MNPTRQQLVTAGLVVLLLVTIFLSRSVLYTVNERELAVVLEFGKPVTSRPQPGIYFKKPFIQEVRRFPKTLQFWETHELIADLLTADGEKIEVAAWAIWRITEPEIFVKILRTIEHAESSQIKVKVRAAIRDVITSHTLTDVIRNSGRELTYTFDSTLPDTKRNETELNPVVPQAVEKEVTGEKPIGRTEILKQVKQRIDKSLDQTADGEPTDRGIELVDVGISNISFVPTVREAAFEKQKAFMESIASKHLYEGVRLKQEILNKTQREVEQILGEGQKKSTITRGEVDAEIIDRYAKAIQATSDFYKFTRTLELYEKSLTQNTQLILTTDNDLFQLFNNFNRDTSNNQTVEN